MWPSTPRILRIEIRSCGVATAQEMGRKRVRRGNHSLPEMRQTGMAELGFELWVEVALVAADQCEDETGGLTGEVSVQEFPQRIARRFFIRLRAR